MFRGPYCLDLQGEMTGDGEKGIDIGLESMSMILMWLLFQIISLDFPVELLDVKVTIHPHTPYLKRPDPL